MINGTLCAPSPLGHAPAFVSCVWSRDQPFSLRRPGGASVPLSLAFLFAGDPSLVGIPRKGEVLRTG